MLFILNPPPDIERVIASECYQALKNVKDILQDSNLNDRECFIKIEEIIEVLKKSEAMQENVMILDNQDGSSEKILV